MSTPKLDDVVKLPVDQALRLAMKMAKEGEISLSKEICNTMLHRFPKNKRVRQALSDINAGAFPGERKSSGSPPPVTTVADLTNLAKAGQYKKAHTMVYELLNFYPKSGDIHNIAGIINKNLQNYDKAVSHFKVALRDSPKSFPLLYNMGSTLILTEQYEKAVTLLEYANKIKPNNLECLNNLALARHNIGESNVAVSLLVKVISKDPDFEPAYISIAQVLRNLKVLEPIPGLDKIIIKLINRKTYVRPSELSQAVLSLSYFSTIIQKLINQPNWNHNTPTFKEDLRTLSEQKLLLNFIAITPLTDIALEKVLIKVRLGFLCLNSESSVPTELLNLQSALALHCHVNEYIYPTSAEEKRHLLRLEQEAENILSAGEQPPPSIILTLASYKALLKYDWDGKLMDNDFIREVVKRQIVNGQRESEYKLKIKALGELTDETSKMVRKQYEENPYPRWVQTALFNRPISVKQLADELHLELHAPYNIMNDEPKILIAGCGTGQHAINTACRFKNCQVLAIDLSVASLAYAKRQSEELGVKNIDYLQADILDLSKLGREFDIIESVGALHHMRSPLTGWRILVNCLKHGGLMRLGLYSDIARKNIVKIRNEVGNGLIGSKNSDLILFRTQLILSNKEHHKQITNLQDFYSLSELRDLLFHTQEWRYNLSEIDTAITDLGLKFSGFEIENKLRKRFSKRFPSPSDIYNLDVWNNYEIQNPSIFSGMYQFWCQKA